MLFRPFLNDASSCASYLFGCGTHAKLAVVDPHADLVDDFADKKRQLPERAVPRLLSLVQPCAVRERCRLQRLQLR